MKVLTQNNILSPVIHNFIRVVGRIGNIAIIQDMNHIAKALNDFQPDLLILEEEQITNVVKAYRDNHQVKIICLGTESTDKNKADFIVDKNINTPKPNIEVSEFIEDMPKLDVSIFCNSEEHAFLTQFICNNYNVKAYGPIKINSPRYLGEVSDVEFFEILNKSKASVVFNIIDAQNSVLLNTYPISYCKDPLITQTFTNLTSLIECMDNLFNQGITDGMSTELNKVKDHYRSDNNFTYVSKVIEQLGFHDQASRLNQICKEII